MGWGAIAVPHHCRCAAGTGILLCIEGITGKLNFAAMTFDVSITSMPSQVWEECKQVFNQIITVWRHHFNLSPPSCQQRAVHQSSISALHVQEYIFTKKCMNSFVHSIFTIIEYFLPLLQQQRERILVLFHNLTHSCVSRGATSMMKTHGIPSCLSGHYTQSLTSKDHHHLSSQRSSWGDWNKNFELEEQRWEFIKEIKKVREKK